MPKTLKNHQKQALICDAQTEISEIFDLKKRENDPTASILPLPVEIVAVWGLGWGWGVSFKNVSGPSTTTRQCTRVH